MNETKYPWTDGEDQPRDTNQLFKWEMPVSLN